jgi:ubiquinone/menaquinone biosynthesis C-methylase UbiE
LRAFRVLVVEEEAADVASRVWMSRGSDQVAAEAAELQARYYAETAETYMALHDEDEHRQALAWLAGWVAMNPGVGSILDVGAGTGANVRRLQEHFPTHRIVGVEPVEEMRRVGYSNGLPESVLRAGNAYDLAFEDGSFDVVTAFGVLHHLEKPELAIEEMSRVAARAVFISDGNTFSHGARRAKLLLRSAGLWPLAVKIKTRGRGWHYSEGDGIAFSYSIFSAMPQLRRIGEVRVMTTRPYRGPNLLRDAATVAVLSVKR